MCLTIPKKVISVGKNKIILEKNGKKEEAGSIIKIQKGDWVLTQNGIIIQKISQKQAKELKNLLKIKKLLKIMVYILI